MKKLLIFITISLLSLSASMACPFCGCGGGNTYLGLLPNFQNGFVGVRYSYSQYHTQLVDDPTQFSTNYYNSIEVWGGIHLGQKFQILAFVPYYQNKQIDDDGTTTPHGLGDITVMGQYRLFNLASFVGKKILSHQLWIGAGIKAPTGSFNVDLNDPNTTVADINAQLGTGSLDYMLNALYSLNIGKFGINTSLNYKINTQNSDHYRYGNRFTGNIIGSYRIKAKSVNISPNVGIGYENTAFNRLSNEAVQYTNSHVTTAIAGVEFNFKRIAIGFNGQIPLAQSYAEGQTDLKFKAMTHVAFAF